MHLNPVFRNDEHVFIQQIAKIANTKHGFDPSKITREQLDKLHEMYTKINDRFVD